MRVVLDTNILGVGPAERWQPVLRFVSEELDSHPFFA